MDKDVWEEAVRNDTDKEVVRSCNRCEEGVYAMKREGIPFVQRRKERGERVCKGTTEERLHSAIEVTTNGAGVLCWKEGW